ncbi:DUF1801 domain-containing protein [Paenibacillus sp. sgz500958]|uniref:DUF1801 domain-containing protein n=1 Tax=Paenibacillus sp. sgz500958 TaxID=3242475 RepID=UPI0036D42131
MRTSQSVTEFMDQFEHPLKPEIEVVRSVILEAHDGITEQIKWNAPSFCYHNEDRITFNFRGKGYFQLIFHCGAKVKSGAGDSKLIDDDEGLLEWITLDRATVKFTDMNDVVNKKEKLVNAVRKWVQAAAL